MKVSTFLPTYASRAQGWIFLVLGFSMFLGFLYAVILSKFLPASENHIVAAIQKDRYFMDGRRWVGCETPLQPVPYIYKCITASWSRWHFLSLLLQFISIGLAWNSSSMLECITGFWSSSFFFIFILLPCILKHSCLLIHSNLFYLRLGAQKLRRERSMK